MFIIPKADHEVFVKTLLVNDQVFILESEVASFTTHIGPYTLETLYLDVCMCNIHWIQTLWADWS